MRPSPATPLPSVEEIVHQYAPQVYRLARRLMGHDADAEDVTQDVLLHVVRKLDTFRGEAALSSWLYRVTVNAALSLRRHYARRRQRLVDTPLATLAEEAMAPSPIAQHARPEQALLEQETQEMIEHAIAGLPKLYHDVYVLSNVERWSNAEIANLLGLSLSAVKSRLHCARLRMRQALAGYFGEVRPAEPRPSRCG